MRSAHLIALACATAVVAAAVPGLASTPPPTGTPIPKRAATVTPGVRVWTQRWTAPNGMPERSSLMSVDLTNSHLRVGVYTSHGRLGSRYEPVSAMMSRTGAVGGVNGDFFNLMSTAGVPVGGIVQNSTLVKTPQPGHRANFYIKTDGTAGIGATPFTGSVFVRRGVQHTITSVNSVNEVYRGGLTMITPMLSTFRVPSHCTLVTMRRGIKQAVTVTSVFTPGSNRNDPVPTLAAGTIALLGCDTVATWLRRYLPRNTKATAQVAFSSLHLAALVSGARVVLDKGVPIDDTTGRLIQGQHAETFACVSQDTKHVLFGTIDMQDEWTESGVSFRQLRWYLLQLKCYTAMEFDGGGSSTLDYRQPSSTRIVTLNHPAAYSERWIPDAMLVYSH